MKALHGLAGSICAAATLLLAAPASSAIITVTYEGSVASGVDALGLFGAAGASLSGLSYTAVYAFDDAAPGATLEDGSPAFTRLITPQSGGTLTVGGVSLPVGDTELQAYQSVISGTGVAQVLHTAITRTSLPGGGYRELTLNNSIFSFVNPFTTSHRYDTPLNYTAGAGDFPFGDLLLIDNGPGGVDILMNVQLRPRSVLVALAGPVAVPEPGQWALMVCGFAAAGGALRRRRRTAVAG